VGSTPVSACTTAGTLRTGIPMPSYNACAAAITRAPKQWAVAGMLAVFAEFEREIIRERVDAGLTQARAARGEARPRSEGLICPGAQSVRNCSTPLLVLLAKSETSAMQRQHALVNSACRPACPRQNDFASSITFGESHVEVMMAYLVLTT
jgi:Resolvase, N terminal domain